MTYSSSDLVTDDDAGWSAGTTMSNGRTSWRSGTILAAISFSFLTLTGRWASALGWRGASASSAQFTARRDHSCTRPVIDSWAAPNTALISVRAARTAWAIRGRSASIPVTAPGLIADA